MMHNAYAEWQYAECLLCSLSQLSLILNVIMLSVVMHNVIMLNVVAPSKIS